LNSFTTLDKYVESKKTEAMSRAAMPPATKAKSSVDKEAVPNKKRKAAKGSQGVENLKKVNTRGMTKISSFFNKKP
jgi:ribonuclease H2 subunit B